MHIRWTNFSVALLILGGFGCSAETARADSCATILKALDATTHAPGIRQYISFSSRSDGVDEHLMAVLVGATAYMATGGSDGWLKIDRREIMAAAKEEAANTRYRDCHALGTEQVHGVVAELYEFTMEDKETGSVADRMRIWIGADGLVRQQQTENGTVRFEFNGVKAPIP
jgi:hypothetical protein